MSNSNDETNLRNARVDNLQTMPYLALLEKDIELYLNGVLTEEGFQKCIVDASKIWKEWKRKDAENTWSQEEINEKARRSSSSLVDEKYV